MAYDDSDEASSLCEINWSYPTEETTPEPGTGLSIASKFRREVFKAGYKYVSTCYNFTFTCWHSLFFSSKTNQLKQT
jgi:hypothetical protein